MRGLCSQRKKSYPILLKSRVPKGRTREIFPFEEGDDMAAQILDGKALAQELRAGFKERVAALAAKGHRPGLVVILVGEDPASQVYVKNKVSACESVGLYSEKLVYPADVAPAVVLEKIAELNADPKVHGILVQLPLPAHFDEAAILKAIAAEKDVDGFHAENVGALAQGQPRFIPCTPYGVMKLLSWRTAESWRTAKSSQSANGVDLSGKEAVVIGRSNIVGKPMALLLINAGATVTVCNSRTRDLAAHTRRADILVAAVGKPRFVTADMVKPGAVVIDVGINRLPSEEGGKLCGDVDFEGVKEVAAWITPVPGGVGPMTITMLLANTIEAAEREAGSST
jgi:methylenetetrahydrofolate dehydrogenase (NADP+)/methenyltetrahydrofolate cyclohydrolase